MYTAQCTTLILSHNKKDYPICESGWIITDTSVFDFSMIDPNTAASVMSAGFFIVIIPGLIVLGASLLLNMLNSV